VCYRGVSGFYDPAIRSVVFLFFENVPH